MEAYILLGGLVIVAAIKIALTTKGNILPIWRSIPSRYRKTSGRMRIVSVRIPDEK